MRIAYANLLGLQRLEKEENRKLAEQAQRIASKRELQLSLRRAKNAEWLEQAQPQPQPLAQPQPQPADALDALMNEQPMSLQIPDLEWPDDHPDFVEPNQILQGNDEESKEPVGNLNLRRSLRVVAQRQSNGSSGRRSKWISQSEMLVLCDWLFKCCLKLKGKRSKKGPK